MSEASEAWADLMKHAEEGERLLESLRQKRLNRYVDAVFDALHTDIPDDRVQAERERVAAALAPLIQRDAACK